MDIFRCISFLALLTFSSVLSQTKIEVKSLVKDFHGNGAVTVGSNGQIFVNEYGIPNADISGSGTRVFLVEPNGKYTILTDKTNGAIGGAYHQDGSYYFNNGNSYTNSDLMRLKDGKLKKIASVSGFSGDLLIDKTNSFIMTPSYTLPLIYKIGFDGKVIEWIRDERLKGCTGITYGEDDVIFVSNFSTGKIYKIINQNSILEFATVPVLYPGYVIGYITYFDNNIYATGYGASKIYRIDMQGAVHEFAGSGEREDFDGDGENSSFLVPNGIDVNPAKRKLYISQNGNGKSAALRYINIPEKF